MNRIDLRLIVVRISKTGANYVLAGTRTNPFHSQ